MHFAKRLQDGTCDVTLTGKFTFEDHMEFRSLIQEIAQPEMEKLVLHMQGVEFIDSAALGMLLLALDESRKHDKPLVISSAGGQVRKMFDMARFDTLFVMI